MNCVRANDHGALGFLEDKRRLNVAITRPRFFLFIVGKSQTLEKNEMWKAMISHLQQQDNGFIRIPKIPEEPQELIQLCKQRKPEDLKIQVVEFSDESD
jgi:superfamily I DNA and/or RNA helicase